MTTELVLVLNFGSAFDADTEAVPASAFAEIVAIVGDEANGFAPRAHYTVPGRSASFCDSHCSKFGAAAVADAGSPSSVDDADLPYQGRAVVGVVVLPFRYGVRQKLLPKFSLPMMRGFLVLLPPHPYRLSIQVHRGYRDVDLQRSLVWFHP